MNQLKFEDYMDDYYYDDLDGQIFDSLEYIFINKYDNSIIYVNKENLSMKVSCQHNDEIPIKEDLKKYNVPIINIYETEDIKTVDLKNKYLDKNYNERDYFLLLTL